jgi:hypothetical protein
MVSTARLIEGLWGERPPATAWWDVSPALWSRRACDVAGRELTPAEWRDVLPDRPYRAVCRRG